MPASDSSESQTARGVLGTKLECTSLDEFTVRVAALAREGRTLAVDFTNTQIVTMRRHDDAFREVTSRFDFFVPDATPLIWCLNFQRGKKASRAYGPAFMRHCIQNSPAGTTHFLLGGSADCLQKLQTNLRSLNPGVQIVGARNGYFSSSQEAEIITEINRVNPDFVWVGLGTPKQQDWIFRNKGQIHRGILLAIGFAFDVNAGTKRDAPDWMHQFGMTWLFRMCSEPRRLIPRYVKYNSLFIFYLLLDGIRFRAWRCSP